jgi:outer membrane protein, adhesin transport system
MELKSVFLSLIIIVNSLNSKAQVVYGLKDCIGIGLEKNFSILIAKNNEEISKNNMTLGNAGFLPSLSLGSRYTGIISSTAQDVDIKGQGETVYNDAKSTSGNVNASLGLTIFNGFYVQTTYKKLSELKQLGELNTQITIENYIADLLSVYYAYVQQVQLVNNKRYAAKLSKERLRIDEERYLLGSNSKLQVLQSRVYFNADSSSLSRQIQSLRTTQIRLNELMAVEDMGAQFNLKDTSILVKPDLMYEKLLDETLKSNTSLLIAEKNKVISGYDYKIVVSRAYPYLNFSGGYNYTLNTSETSSSYKNQLVNGPNYGLTLGFNLFNGFNSRKDIKNSAINIKTTELRYQETEQGVKADLITIYSAYNNNLKLITLQEQNYETAAENLSIAFEKYKLGNLSGLDLRDVQKSLLDAKESLLSIQYLAKLAEISLLQISGRIMEYY